LTQESDEFFYIFFGAGERTLKMVFFILAIESLKVCFFDLTQESDEFFYIFFGAGERTLEMVWILQKEVQFQTLFLFVKMLQVL